MALVHDKDNNLIGLDSSNESGSIINSKVYYNNRCIYTLKNLKKYYYYLIDDLTESKLKGIHHDDNGLILIYKNHAILVRNFDKVIKIDYKINSCCYRTFNNNKIMCYAYGMAMVDEKTNKIIVIEDTIIQHSLPKYDIILGMSYSPRKDSIKVKYLYEGQIMRVLLSRKGVYTEPIVIKTYTMIHKNNFIFLCENKGVKAIKTMIHNGVVYNLIICRSYIDKIVNIIGNIIFLLDDEKYYYCTNMFCYTKKSLLEFMPIDTDKYSV